MKRHRALLPIIVSFALACALVILYWTKQSDKSLVRLRVVRLATEQGKPVVFFKLEGASNRRIQIADVERIVGALKEGPFQGIELSYSKLSQEPAAETSSKADHLGIWTPTANFWPASQPWPLHDTKKARKEFALLAPTNGQSWKLRVTVNVENLSLGKRLSNMPILWKPLRQHGYSLLRATRSAWNAFYQFDTYTVESELITNSFAPESFSKAMQ